MKKLLKRCGKVLFFILLLLISVLLIASFYIKQTFPMVTIDELYFYWNNGVTNSSMKVVWAAVSACIIPVLIIYLIYIFILYDITFGHLKLSFLTNLLHNKKVKENKKKIGKIKENKSHSIQIYPFKITNNHRIISSIVVVLISGYIIFSNLNCVQFVRNTTAKSKFIEINYVAPEETKVTFNEKRNLIFITVESLETSFFTRKQGGYWNYEVIPELYSLLDDDDAVVFYNTDKHEQMTMLAGTTWTTAGLVANSSGLPFKIPINGNEYHSENFMNGAYTLGDLLEDNGYYNELISTAKTNFGGVNEYYTKHGNYNIIDINNLKKFGFNISKSEKNSWGFSDKYLFEIAKKRLGVISEQDQPFNLQLITIDTHFPDGHKYSYTSKAFDTQYENVYSTTSKQIYDFIEWLKEQDYYDDTLIVIVGDHISMQEEYFTERGINTADRYIYNCYINSAVEPDKTEERIYTELDTYPSIVAALGGEIDGNRLGLGINLFSSQKTLIERYGRKSIDEEIIKKSSFYNKKILGSDYEVMVKQVGLDDLLDEDDVEQKN